MDRGASGTTVLRRGGRYASGDRDVINDDYLLNENGNSEDLDEPRITRWSILRSVIFSVFGGVYFHCSANLDGFTLCVHEEISLFTLLMTLQFKFHSYLNFVFS